MKAFDLIENGLVLTISLNDYVEMHSFRSDELFIQYGISTHSTPVVLSHHFCLARWHKKRSRAMSVADPQLRNSTSYRHRHLFSECNLLASVSSKPHCKYLRPPRKVTWSYYLHPASSASPQHE